MELERGKNFGRYELVNRLWEGNFGETWRAQTSRGEPVVIQRLQDEAIIQEFKRHSVKIVDISSPYIARLLTLETEANAIVWEYMSGRRTYTYIKQLKVIKNHIAVYIARKVLEVLSLTASNGLVHGGLRPTRVIITPDKKIMLTNFGIGHLEQRVLSQVVNRNDEKKLKKFAHILPYFPQEVLEDQLYDDPKSDIYAVGIMLAEMLTGECAPGDKMKGLLAAKGIDGRIAGVILKAVADFEERYNHPNEMYLELSRLLKNSDQVEKIYVPPPTIGLKNIALEAIPADSEEYRIYQADVFSARQVIDAEVVAAEPVDFMDEREHLGIPSTDTTKAPTGRPAIDPALKKTARLDADALLLISTIDKKILDPLEKDPIYPQIFLKFITASACLFVFLTILALFPPDWMRRECFVLSWLFAPFHEVDRWGTFFKAVGNLVLFGQAFFFILLPFLDPQARLNQRPVWSWIFLSMIFMTIVAGILGFIGM